MPWRKLTNIPDQVDVSSLLNPFESKRCLIIVNNFHGIDTINPFNYPWITRRPQLARVHLTCRREVIELWYVPFHFILKDENNVFLKNHTCRLSKTFLNSQNFTSLFDKCHDICVRLEQPGYSAKSKPWTCQVDVDILPEQFQLSAF